MPKRLTDTEKWDRPWFRSLRSDHKLLWLYVLDKCDMAGIWYADLQLASFFIGCGIDTEEVLQAFEKQIEVVDGGKKWRIIDFIKFQYGPTFKPTSKVHASVVKCIEAQGLPSSWPTLDPTLGPTLGPTPKDKDKKKDKEKATTYPSDFLKFWEVYPKKTAKADAAKAWAKVADEPGILNAVLAAIKNQAASPDWLKDGGQYIPYPASWLNARRWEDEITQGGINAAARTPSVLRSIR